MKKPDAVQQARDAATKASYWADLYFNRVLGGLILARPDELFTHKGRATTLGGLLEFLGSDVLRHPTQLRVLRAMQSLQAEGMPIDMLTVFGRMEEPSNGTAFELAQMVGRTVHSQHVLVWALLGYEFRACADLIEVITAPIHRAIQMNFHQMSEICEDLHLAIMGGSDRLYEFESCCQYIEQYLMGLSFGMDVSEIYAKHRQRISNLKLSQTNA